MIPHPGSNLSAGGTSPASVDLLVPTGRGKASQVRRGGVTAISYLWVADGMATRRVRALIAWMTGQHIELSEFGSPVAHPPTTKEP